MFVERFENPGLFTGGCFVCEVFLLFFYNVDILDRNRNDLEFLEIKQEEASGRVKEIFSDIESVIRSTQVGFMFRSLYGMFCSSTFVRNELCRIFLLMIMFSIQGEKSFMKYFQYNICDLKVWLQKGPDMAYIIILHLRFG